MTARQTPSGDAGIPRHRGIGRCRFAGSNLFSWGEPALTTVEQVNRWLCHPAVIPLTAIAGETRESLLTTILRTVHIRVRRARAQLSQQGLIEIHSRGTALKKTVHDNIVEAMAKVGIDIADYTSAYVAALKDFNTTDYLVIMSCSIMKIDPARYGVESSNWDLKHPDTTDMDVVWEVREEIRRRVETMLDGVEELIADWRANEDSPDGIISSIRTAFSLQSPRRRIH